MWSWLGRWVPLTDSRWPVAWIPSPLTVWRAVSKDQHPALLLYLSLLWVWLLVSRRFHGKAYSVRKRIQAWSPVCSALLNGKRHTPDYVFLSNNVLCSSGDKCGYVHCELEEELFHFKQRLPWVSDELQSYRSQEPHEHRPLPGRPFPVYGKNQIDSVPIWWHPWAGE